VVATRWALMAAGGLFVLGCAGDDELPPATVPEHGAWELGFEVPATTQVVGDPIVGRDLLLNGGYMGCGVPARLLDFPLLADVVTSVLTPAGKGQKLEGRNEVNANLGHNMNIFESLDGVQVANVGCLMCHAGSFNGELIIGLGTADSDFTKGFGAGDQSTTGAALPSSLTDLLGLSDAEAENLNKMLTRSAAFTGITAMRTVGQNPAEAMAIALMAHRNPDLSWSDTPVVAWEFRDRAGNVDAPVAFPSDVPPWWRAKKKNALFYNAMARGDHSGSMALATSICIDNTVQAEIIRQKFHDMHAFVLTLEAPKYPLDIDMGLADKGERVFIENCAGCHGTYGETDAEDTYPNLLFPLDVVGTDTVLAEGGVIHAPQMTAAYNQTYYGQLTPFVVNDPAIGYVAPPLDGIWATGPFLHNGSVPTIELLLDSKSRPTRWRREDYDSKNFDENAVGWPYVEFEGLSEASVDDLKHIYDTTMFGQANTGHTFGDHLTKDQRRAVLEYLKTL
jgi:hypothetical protein